MTVVLILCAAAYVLVYLLAFALSRAAGKARP